MRQMFGAIATVFFIFLQTSLADGQEFQGSITDTWVELKPGISKLTRVQTSPSRRMHAVQINFNEANVSLRASNNNDAALTPKKFAQKIGAYIAINGDFFDPKHKFQPLGPAVGTGIHWPKTPFYQNWFIFACVGQSNCEIKKYPGAIDSAWNNVVGGRDQILKDGIPWTTADDKKCGQLCTSQDPRTVLGLNADGSVLTLLAVEGRQKDASGIPVSQAAKILAELGATDGLHLDGGGSTQLVIDGQLVTRRPETEPAERPVGNCLGILLNP